MTLTPIRDPAYWFSNRGNSAPGDALHRNAEFVADPAVELSRQFGIGADFPIMGLAWLNGFATTVNGTDGPAGMLDDPKVARYCMDQISTRRGGGKQTWLYISRLLPNGETFKLSDASTVQWMTREVAPYIEAGVSTIFIDETALDVLRLGLRASARIAAALGVRIGGNAWPYQQAGLDTATNPQVPRDRLDMLSIYTCPWLVSSQEQDIDPGRLFGFDPDLTEVRYCMADDRSKPVKDVIARVRDLRSRGYVVDQLMPARDEVRKEILAGQGAGNGK